MVASPWSTRTQPCPCRAKRVPFVYLPQSSRSRARSVQHPVLPQRYKKDCKKPIASNANNGVSSEGCYIFLPRTENRRHSWWRKWKNKSPGSFAPPLNWAHKMVALCHAVTCIYWSVHGKFLKRERDAVAVSQCPATHPSFYTTHPPAVPAKYMFNSPVPRWVCHLSLQARQTEGRGGGPPCHLQVVSRKPSPSPCVWAAAAAPPRSPANTKMD